MTLTSTRRLHACIKLEASPAAVWRVVSDLRRTPDWSDECRRVVPIGAVRRGCWLIGLNRRGAVRWATLSRVIQCRPDQEIAWRVLTNGSVWTYRIDGSAGGATLTQTRQTPHGVKGFARWFTARFLGGQEVHDDELEAGMARGLHRIKTLVMDESS